MAEQCRGLRVAQDDTQRQRQQQEQLKYPTIPKRDSERKGDYLLTTVTLELDRDYVPILRGNAKLVHFLRWQRVMEIALLHRPETPRAAEQMYIFPPAPLAHLLRVEVEKVVIPVCQVHESNCLSLSKCGMTEVNVCLHLTSIHPHSSKIYPSHPVSRRAGDPKPSRADQ